MALLAMGYPVYMSWLPNGFLKLLAMALPYITLFLICMSRERVEDGSIRHQRSVAIFSVVVFAFVCGLVGGFLDSYYLWFERDIEAVGKTRIAFMPARSIISLSVIYLIIFKSLLAYNKEQRR